MSKKFTVLDLFAGVGGLSFAFHEHPAFSVVAANEILEITASAYRLNHPATKVYVKDVRQFSRLDLSLDFGDDFEVDVILGGPPCQSFSTAGKRDILDSRATLFEEYQRLLQELRPKIFVFENVRGLVSMEKGRFFEKIVHSFSSLGYEIQTRVLDAADYGAPQLRKRIILVGSLPGFQFEYPNRTHAPENEANDFRLTPHLTLRDAIGDLPTVLPGTCMNIYEEEPRNEFQERMRWGSSSLDEHASPLYGEKLSQIMGALPEGGSAWDLPEKLRPTSGFGNSYGRLWWDRPSPTITRNLGTPSSARCVHPSLPRALTTREGARLQCFPDSFKFSGTRSQKNLQIGEAVPPVLSYALLPCILETLKRSEKKEDKSGQLSLSYLARHISK